MPVQETQPRWIERVRQIPSAVEDIRLPEAGEDLPQDQERCEVVLNREVRRMRFHDYHKLYEIPGLYERLFYERLGCCSPSRVVGLLEEILQDSDEKPSDLCVLDVGAGNGMVGDELRAMGVGDIVGVDIIAEAKQATDRDRPGVYDEYVVADLTNLPEAVEKRLRRRNFSCLTCVAALGFGDIPPAAFLKALDLICTPGWVALNIKEDFLSERDSSGFCKLIRQLSRGGAIQTQAYRRYRHRLSASGRPLYYVAMVARKLKDVPDHIIEAYEAPPTDTGVDN